MLGEEIRWLQTRGKKSEIESAELKASHEDHDGSNSYSKLATDLQKMIKK